MVSIIIPVYNAEATILRCIESIENQTYEDYEVVIINDGSTDKSENICKELENKYNNIRLFNIKNSGVSVARNLGIKYAKGEFIQFVDADDEVDKNYTKLMIEKQKENDYDLVVCGYFEITRYRTKERTYYDVVFNFGDKNFFELLKTNCLLNTPWNKLYKRKLILHEFPSDMNMGEDLIFNILYMKNTKNIYFMSECLYNYFYISDNSLTSLYSKRKLMNVLDLDNFFIKLGMSRIYFPNFISNCYGCFSSLTQINNISIRKIYDEIKEYSDTIITHKRELDYKNLYNKKYYLFIKLLYGKNYSILLVWYLLIRIKNLMIKNLMIKNSNKMNYINRSSKTKE